MIYAIMTALNEANSLLALLPRLPATVNGHELCVIVVDDGSTDATADVARAHGCTVIRSEVNRGKGASLRSGLEALGNEHFEAVVLMDSDGQHDPAELAALTEPILDGVAELVVGSRYLTTTRRGRTPWNRYLVRSATVSILNTILSTQVTDPYSGYRALTPRAIECITLRGDRYESELEMLFCAERRGLRVVEVPVPKIYGPATSKMGVRRGRVLGRMDVVSRYALTIARETARLRRGHDARAREVVSP
jgi:glycosyltransferase involved in cell wall biosynthesis